VTIERQLIVAGTAGGQAVQTLVSDAYNSRRRTSLVVYTHGVGETETAPTADIVKDGVVQALIDAGCIVVSSNASGNAWGNPQSVSDYVAAVAYSVAQWRADDVLIFSQSMGGVAGLNLFASDAIANVRGWAGIYPVTSLSAVFANNLGAFASQIRTAYGIAANGSDYAARTAGSDPGTRPNSTWSGRRLRMWASTGDTVVGRAANADTLATAAAAGGALESTVVACTGDHGDPSHFQPSDMIAFLNRCGMGR
jgi:alpha-beta hydrolase superfamily lysophospholipase